MRIAVAGGTGVVGRYTVQAALADDHEVVVLARSQGIDIFTGEGLGDALEGVDAVIDATNAGTLEEAPATEFFTRSTANLQEAGADHGVRHLVTLSIVGIHRVPTGYYAAKLAHERAALVGPVPATVLRATQFYEFAGQMIHWNVKGSVARVPNMYVQPVAARAVGRVLVEAAAGSPQGFVLDLAGPEPADLVSLARQLSNRLGLGIEVQPSKTELSADTLLPSGDARIEGPTFREWLESDDPLQLKLTPAEPIGR